MSKIVTFANEAVNHKNAAINARLIEVMKAARAQGTLSEADIAFLDSLNIRYRLSRDLILTGPNDLQLHYNLYNDRIETVHGNIKSSAPIDMYNLLTSPDAKLRREYPNLRVVIDWTNEMQPSQIVPGEQTRVERPIWVYRSDPLRDYQEDYNNFSDVELSRTSRYDKEVRDRITEKIQKKTGYKIVVGDDGKRHAVRIATEALANDHTAENAEIYRILRLGKVKVDSPLLDAMNVRLDWHSRWILTGSQGQRVRYQKATSTKPAAIYGIGKKKSRRFGLDEVRITEKEMDLSKIDYYSFLTNSPRRAKPTYEKSHPDPKGDLLAFHQAEINLFKQIKESEKGTQATSWLRLPDKNLYHVSGPVKAKDYERVLQAATALLAQIDHYKRNQDQYVTPEIALDMFNRVGQVYKTAVYISAIKDIERVTLILVKDLNRAIERRQLDREHYRKSASELIQNVANRTGFHKKENKED
jgi:hypothetical protein